MVVWGLGTSYQCSLRGLVARALIAGGQVGIALCVSQSTKEKSCYICKRNHLHPVNICFCSSYLLSYRNWRQSIKCTESPSLAFCFVCANAGSQLT